jgi:hypothetical protein
LAFGLASLLSTTAPPRALGAPPGDEAIDVLEVAGNRVYHLDEALGLLVYDVSDIDHPHLAGRHPIVGGPLGVAVRGNIVTIVLRTREEAMAAPGAPPSGLVQSVDLRDPAHPRVLGESTLEGYVREARATQDMLYVLSETRDATGPHVILTFARLDGMRPAAAISVRRDGLNGSLRVTGGRIVLARANPTGHGTRVELFADSAPDFSSLGSLGLDATIDAGDSDVSARLDATDPARVRVLACPTVLCPAGAPLEVTTLDTTTTPPRVMSRRRVASPGTDLTTRFDGDRLYLASRERPLRGAPRSIVSVVDLEGKSTTVAQVTVRGTPLNLVPDGGRLLAFGTRRSGTIEREDLYVGSIDVHDAAHPTLASEVVIGEGWTWSPALASTQALGVDGDTIAVPFDTFDPEAEHSSVRPGVAVLETASGVLRTSGTVWSNAPADRVAMLRGRLLVATTFGLTSIDEKTVRKTGFAQPPTDR